MSKLDDIFNVRDGEGNFKNFGIIMPSDVMRKADGTPMLYVSPEDKEAFIRYLNEQIIDGESMSINEREKLFKEWKEKQPR